MHVINQLSLHTIIIRVIDVLNILIAGTQCLELVTKQHKKSHFINLDNDI